MQDTVQINDRFTIARFAPDGDQLRQAEQEGFRSIVNMQTSDEKRKLKMKPQEERRRAEEAGLTYLHYPVNGNSLSDKLVDGFRREASNLPSPVLVHCASGKRSGTLVIMDVACEHGLTGGEAIEAAEELGFECNSPDLETFVKGYVNRHNAQGEY